MSIPFEIPIINQAVRTNTFSFKQTAATASISVDSWDGSNETKIPTLSGVTIRPNSGSQKVLLLLHLFGEWSENSHSCSVSLKRVGGVETWLDARETTSGGAAGGSGIGNRKPVNAGFALTYRLAEDTSTPESLNLTFVDEPNTTEQITYDVYLINTADDANYNLNRTSDDLDTKNYERGVSTFSAECKG